MSNLNKLAQQIGLFFCLESLKYAEGNRVDIVGYFDIKGDKS